MTGAIKILQKTAIERRRIYLDYSCWLEDAEKLTGFQVAISPVTAPEPLKVNVGYTDATNKKLAMFVSGGVGYTDYIMQITVNTDSGQVKRDDIGLRVYP